MQIIFVSWNDFSDGYANSWQFSHEEKIAPISLAGVLSGSSDKSCCSGKQRVREPFSQNDS